MRFAIFVWVVIGFLAAKADDRELYAKFVANCFYDNKILDPYTASMKKAQSLEL